MQLRQWAPMDGLTILQSLSHVGAVIITIVTHSIPQCSTSLSPGAVLAMEHMATEITVTRTINECEWTLTQPTQVTLAML